MSKKKLKRNSKRNGVIPIILFYSPILFLKLIVAFLKFKRKARNASKIFKKELKKSGLTKDHVKELTLKFEEFASVRKFLNLGNLIGNLSK